MSGWLTLVVHGALSDALDGLSGKAPAKSTPAESKAGKKTASKKTAPAAEGDKKKRKKSRKETYSSYIYKGRSLIDGRVLLGLGCSSFVG